MASGKEIRISIQSALNAAGIEATKSQVAAMASSVKKHLGDMAAHNRRHWADIKAAWDMGLGVMRKIGGFIQSAIRKAFDAEYALTNFKTMLGSIDAAKKHVADLKQFAAQTPLTFDDLAQASKTLLAFGANVNDVVPSLKTLGDISLGNAEKFQSLSLAFGKIQSEGKLTGVTLKQMIIAGFNPLQEIAQKTGASMDELKDMMEKGGISFDLVQAAMQSATSEGGRFHDALKDASQTGAGLFSTMQDNWNATVVKFGGAFMEAAKGGIAKIIEKIQALNSDGSVEIWADKTARAVEKVLAIVKEAVKWCGKLVDAYRWVVDQAEQGGAYICGVIGTKMGGGTWDEAFKNGEKAMLAQEREQRDAKREAEEREAAIKKEAAKATEAKVAEKKNELAKTKTLEEIFQEQKQQMGQKTQKQIEREEKAAHNRRLKWLREECSERKQLASEARRSESEAESKLQQAWGWYRDKGSMAAQLQEERENARAEKQFNEDLLRLQKNHKNWRDAENLSIDEEAIRRVAHAYEEREEAAEFAAVTADAPERAAKALEFLQKVFENAGGQ